MGKSILEKADSRLIEALQNGTLTIHRAVQWCSMSRTQQVEQLTRYTIDRATNKVIRRTISRLKEQSTGPDPIILLSALQRIHSNNPGSIAVRLTKLKQTVILVGQDLCAEDPGPKLA